MNTIEWIAQIVGIFAMAFNILSYQQQTRGGAIAFQLVGGLLFSVNFFMLNAVVGGILNAIATVRAVIFLNKEKLHADHPIWLGGFIATFVATYILSFTVFGKEPTVLNFVIELLPVIGMTATTISFRLTDAKSIRKYRLLRLFTALDEGDQEAQGSQHPGADLRRQHCIVNPGADVNDLGGGADAVHGIALGDVVQIVLQAVLHLLLEVLVLCDRIFGSFHGADGGFVIR